MPLCSEDKLSAIIQERGEGAISSDKVAVYKQAPVMRPIVLVGPSRKDSEVRISVCAGGEGLKGVSVCVGGGGTQRYVGVGGLRGTCVWGEGLIGVSVCGGGRRGVSVWEGGM